MRDQTIKADAGKRRLSLVPTQINYDIAEVREYGINKYGDTDSWLRVEIERYKDAAYRHWLAYLADPDSVDEESGIKHYKHWACNAAFICELEKRRVERLAKMAPAVDVEYEEVVTKHKQKTCEHEWVVVCAESNDAIAVLKCKKCGKKTLRQHEVCYGKE